MLPVRYRQSFMKWNFLGGVLLKSIFYYIIYK